MRAEAEKRGTFLDECCKTDFAHFTIRYRKAGLRIKNLTVNKVIPQMNAVAARTVDADTGAVNFRETINIVEFNIEYILDALPHLVAPAFRTDDSFFQTEFIADASFLDFFSKQKRIG